MRDGNRNLLRLSFEAAGVAFIPENGSGAGVSLKKGAPDGYDQKKSFDEGAVR